jgi:hypothetical protein
MHLWKHFYRRIQHSFHFWIIEQKKLIFLWDCAEKKLLNRNIFILKHSTVSRGQTPLRTQKKLLEIIFKIVWKKLLAIIADRGKEKFIKYQICSRAKLTSLLWIFLSKVSNWVMKYCHPRRKKNWQKNHLYQQMITETKHKMKFQ